MKFSEVPEGCYFIIIREGVAMPVLHKTEKKIELEIGFLQCHKQVDSSSLKIPPDTEVQLVKI